MKKMLNRPADFVTEMLDGLIKAHPTRLAFEHDLHCIVRADAPVKGKVALATGGGSGHLPVFLGYVGRGMLDGCAVGDVFASPSAETMLAVTKRIDGGKGVVYIYGNYGGDVMNFDMAAETADMEGIPVRTWSRTTLHPPRLRRRIAAGAWQEWYSPSKWPAPWQIRGDLRMRLSPRQRRRFRTSALWELRSHPARCRWPESRRSP